MPQKLRDHVYSREDFRSQKRDKRLHVASPRELRMAKFSEQQFLDMEYWTSGKMSRSMFLGRLKRLESWLERSHADPEIPHHRYELQDVDQKFRIYLPMVF